MESLKQSGNPLTLVPIFFKYLASVLHSLFQLVFQRFQPQAIEAQQPQPRIPVSVNYHFTRRCNYECGFCFHTAKTSYKAPLKDAKKGLSKLAAMGMKKLNLSGGEPFLYPGFVGEICKFAKEELKLESVSIVSNGSKITQSFFEEYASYVDILAISVDSFDEDTNKSIGRGKGNHLPQMRRIAGWCRDYSIKFKLNSVINKYNVAEDFSNHIAELNPCRWKCFQVLAVDTENQGVDAKRSVDRFLISDAQFQDFCQRHGHLTCFVPESNLLMKSSYVILDEYLRFLSKGDNYRTSRSIVEEGVDVEKEFLSSDYDHKTFEDRGGVYDWARGDCMPENLQW